MKLCKKIEQIRGEENSFAFAKIIGIEWEDLSAGSKDVGKNCRDRRYNGRRAYRIHE